MRRSEQRGLVTHEDFDQHTEGCFLSPFSSPLTMTVTEWLWGNRGDHVFGRVYLEAYMGNCLTQAVRCKKTL